MYVNTLLHKIFYHASRSRLIFLPFLERRFSFLSHGRWSLASLWFYHLQIEWFEPHTSVCLVPMLLLSPRLSCFLCHHMSHHWQRRMAGGVWSTLAICHRSNFPTAAVCSPLLASSQMFLWKPWIAPLLSSAGFWLTLVALLTLILWHCLKPLNHELEKLTDDGGYATSMICLAWIQNQ